jgi:hypothetical protein
LDPEVQMEVMPVQVNSECAAKTALLGCSFALVTADQPQIQLWRWVDDAAKALHMPYLRTMYDSYGPLFVPGVSPCFKCVEDYWRSQSGEHYDDVTCGAVVHAEQTLPANPAHIAIASGTYAEEATIWLSRLGVPRSLGGVVRMSSAGVRKTDIPFSTSCQYCSTMRLQ